MYFPEDMNFQYFFFDTYIGYFLQALPIALLVSAVYGFIRFKKDKDTPLGRKIFSCAFVCYVTGLVCLVIGLDVMNIMWYRLIYHMDPGRSINWFGGDIDIVPDFWNHLNGESIGNFLMFLPFGILYPLTKEHTVWKKCVLKCVLAVVVIEILQPVFNRAFDINDIILNSMGIVLSTTVCMVAKRIFKHKSRE